MFEASLTICEVWRILRFAGLSHVVAHYDVYPPTIYIFLLVGPQPETTEEFTCSHAALLSQKPTAALMRSDTGLVVRKRNLTMPRGGPAVLAALLIALATRLYSCNLCIRGTQSLRLDYSAKNKND